jgi:hypothetical protein
MADPADVEQQWFYSLNGERIGPVPAQELVRLLEAGEVAATDLAWHVGMRAWVPIADAGLPLPPLPTTPPPLPPAAMIRTGDVQTSSTVATAPPDDANGSMEVTTCPACGSRDCKSFQVIHNEGTVKSLGTGVMLGGVFERDGVAPMLGVQVTGSTAVSELARLAAPPERKHVPDVGEGAGCMGLIIGVIIAFIVGVSISESRKSRESADMSRAASVEEVAAVMNTLHLTQGQREIMARNDTTDWETQRIGDEIDRVVHEVRRRALPKGENLSWIVGVIAGIVVFSIITWVEYAITRRERKTAIAHNRDVFAPRMGEWQRSWACMRCGEQFLSQAGGGDGAVSGSILMGIRQVLEEYDKASKNAPSSGQPTLPTPPARSHRRRTRRR